MSETFRLFDYRIRIGNEDIIERHLHGILSTDPENVENQEKSQTYDTTYDKLTTRLATSALGRVVGKSSLTPLKIKR